MRENGRDWGWDWGGEAGKRSKVALWATAVMMREPPEAPMDSIRLLSFDCCGWWGWPGGQYGEEEEDDDDDDAGAVTISGEIDDSGRAPGRMKFAGEGTKPNALEAFGMEKSFISLFMMMPVSGTMSWEPKRRLMVVVREMANPSASTTLI